MVPYIVRISDGHVPHWISKYLDLYRKWEFCIWHGASTCNSVVLVMPFTFSFNFSFSIDIDLLLVLALVKILIYF